MAKQWLCIDCGDPVNRRVKRCATCNRANMSRRGTYERTPERRAHMSEVLKGRQPRGTGWQHEPETRAKIAAAWSDEKREQARQRGLEKAQDRAWRDRIAHALSGENNPMWQGGIAENGYAPGFSKTLKAAIRARDLHFCQLCGVTETEHGSTLSIHHADYDKTNHDESNLFAVCRRCNSLVNTNREIWYSYFVALADARGEFSKNIGEFIGRKVIAQRKGLISISHDGGPDLSGLFAAFTADES